MLRLDINLLFTVINLLIWYVLIRKFLFQPVNEVIRKREESIALRYADAKKLQAEALEEKEKCTAYQAEITEEKKKAIEAAKETARTEYQRILLDAQKKADEIVEHSKKEAELEKEKIVGKAEQEIRSLVLEAAVRSMQNTADNAALYDQFLEKAGEATHAE